MKHKSTFIPALTVALSVLVVTVSCIGLFTPGFYNRETPNWQVQSAGQDAIDLLVAVPFLIVSAFFAARGHAKALLVWAGVLLFLLYTFLIYCFDVHFNRLFILYCFTLGMTFYSLVYFIYLELKNDPVVTLRHPLAAKIAGYYFIFLSVSFYFLWLSEVLPAILQNTIPSQLADVGLPTNPVHVIDLSLFLPALLITGILVLRKKMVGYLLIPVFLIFFILMDITIGYLAWTMTNKGLSEGMGVAAGRSVLALWSAGLLVWFWRNVEVKI